ARVFFQSTIPKELEESAKIDGCSNFKLFFKIILPLSAPIIAVMALFYGVDQWNNYFDALIYIKDRSLYPLQMVLREILVMQEMAAQDASMTEELASALHSKQELAAIIKYGVMIVSSLPVIIVYPFLQRFFVQGVMIGSLKGCDQRHRDYPGSHCEHRQREDRERHHLREGERDREQHHGKDEEGLRRQRRNWRDARQPPERHHCDGVERDKRECRGHRRADDAVRRDQRDVEHEVQETGDGVDDEDRPGVAKRRQGALTPAVGGAREEPDRENRERGRRPGGGFPHHRRNEGARKRDERQEEREGGRSDE